MADIRNHHRARVMSRGMTLPLVVASSSFINGTLTRLKKNSRPIQVMPATKWIQRTSIRKLVLKSEGKLIWGAKRVTRAELAKMPPKISALLLQRAFTQKILDSMRADRIAHAGIVHKRE